VKAYIKKFNDKEILTVTMGSDFDDKTKRFKGWLSTDSFGNKSCELRIDNSYFDKETQTWVKG